MRPVRAVDPVGDQRRVPPHPRDKAPVVGRVRAQYEGGPDKNAQFVYANHSLYWSIMGPGGGGGQAGGGRVARHLGQHCLERAVAAHILEAEIDNRGETDAKSAMSVNGSWKMYDKLKAVSFDTPPYSLTYPKLKTILEDNPSAPAGNSIVDNVSYKSEFIVRKPDNDSYWNKILMLDNNLSGFNEPSDTRNNDASLIRFVIKEALGSNDDFKPLPLDEIGIHGN